MALAEPSNRGLALNAASSVATSLAVAHPSVDWAGRYAGEVPISTEFLGDDEEVLVDLRPHWLFLFGPAAVSALAVVLALTVATVFPHAPSAVAWLLLLMVAIPAVWLAGRILRWLGTSLVVTTSRLLLRRGVLGRDLVQLRLERINEVHTAQTLLERLVGSGRLVVEVSGEGGLVAVDDVRRPKALQRVLNGQINAVGERIASTPTMYGPPDLPVRPPAVPVPGRGIGEQDTTPARGVPVGQWPPARSRPVPPDPRPVPGRSLTGPDGRPDLGSSVTEPGRPPGPDPVPPFTAPDPSVARSEAPDPAHRPPVVPGPPAPGPGPSGGPSIPEQLIQLDDLRRRGILTDQEFQSKKAELLDRL